MTIEYWPASDGIHVVEICNGYVRQVGWLWLPPERVKFSLAQKFSCR